MRKSIAFTAGILLGLVTTCSGLATYAPAMVSMQLAQTLLALLPVPALLALGAPLTLWLEVRGPREGEDGAGGPPLLRSRTVRLLSDPFTGAAVSCALLLGLYRSSLIEASLSSSWVHVLVLLAAMVAGLLLLWPVLGVDPAPGVRSRLESALCVAGVAACLGLLAVQLRGGDQLLAAVWFLELRWGWVDPVADQRVAGTVAGAAAAVLVVVAAVPLLRPARTPTGSSAGSAPAR